MIANYHTHTARCGHATGTEREYIESAIKAGFKTLGFSDHVPQPFPDTYHSHIRMRMDEVENYTDTLVKLREEYKNDIQIFIGYEAEYFPKYFEKMIEEIKKFPIDYLIQGQHFIPDEVEGFYAGRETDLEETLKDYVDLTIEGMKTGVFTYLAHPDLIYYTGADEIYRKHMIKIIEASLELDIPLEVNMLGFREGRNYPCDKFFDLASSMGAKFIIGCDAHDSSSLLQPEDVPEFTELLKKYNIATGDNLLELRPIK